METETMDRMLTEVTIENLQDLLDVQRGQLAPEGVRRVVVADALVGTGATTLALPARFLRQLGLRKRYVKRTTSPCGVGETDVYEAVRVTIQGRDTTVDVLGLPDDVPVLIGQIPLEMMDFVVDLASRRLIGNPAHGGEQTLELY